MGLQDSGRRGKRRGEDSDRGWGCWARCEGECSNSYSKADMKEVLCSVCQGRGHLSCGRVKAPSPFPSCANCGEEGHTHRTCSQVRIWSPRPVLDACLQELPPPPSLLHRVLLVAHRISGCRIADPSLDSDGGPTFGRFVPRALAQGRFKSGRPLCLVCGWLQ